MPTCKIIILSFSMNLQNIFDVIQISQSTKLSEFGLTLDFHCDINNIIKHLWLKGIDHFTFEFEFIKNVLELIK